jgi:hypothetical protein
MDLRNATGDGLLGLDSETTTGYDNELHGQLTFDSDLYPSHIRRSCFLVFFYATSFVAPFGIIGNVFSIVVFLSCANFRRTSTVQYLIGLAVTDSLYLAGELLYTWSTPTPWRTYLTPINFVYTTDFGCKSIMWLRYRSRFIYSLLYFR